MSSSDLVLYIRLCPNKRTRLDYGSIKRVITTSQKSKTGYVQPFLETVHAKDVRDCIDVIEHPMDLSTMLVELENGEYSDVYDVKIRLASCSTTVFPRVSLNLS